jgi:ribonuclease P protein component
VDDSSSSGEGPKDVSACQSKGKNFRLTRDDRIRRGSDYGRIMKEGGRFRTSHFAIRMLRNPLGRARLGIIAGKKVGNACARNRIKRRLREYFRLNRDKMPPGTDMVFIAGRGAASLDTFGLVRELDQFFR